MRTEYIFPTALIGNSVPVMTAAAMCEADFREVS